MRMRFMAEGDSNLNYNTFAGPRADIRLAPGAARPRPDPREAHPAAVPRSRVEPAAVILDGQPDAVVAGLEGYGRALRPRVAGDVGEGFLGNAEQAGLRLIRQAAGPRRL